MALLGNIIWFILGGWWNFLLYGLLGILCCITIIGIPIGKSLFQYAKLMAFPFGKVIVRETDIKGKENVSAVRRAGGVIANILWLPFGIISFVANIILMLGAAITIIGIPVAVVIARSSKFLLWPIGAKVISKEQAQMSQKIVSAEVLSEVSEASSVQQNRMPKGYIYTAVSLGAVLFAGFVILAVGYITLIRKADKERFVFMEYLDPNSLTIPDSAVIPKEDAEDTTLILPYDQCPISGRWKTAWRQGDEHYSEIVIQYINFYPDGTVETFQDLYLHTAHIPQDGEDGWYKVAEFMGYNSGTYTFDGEELILEEWIQTISVRNLDVESGSVEFGGIMYVLDDREEFSEMEDLCDRLGVDDSAPALPVDDSNPAEPHSQASIIGWWMTVRREGNEIWTSYYELSEFGTFYKNECGYTNTAYDPMDGEDGWYVMPMGFPGSGGTYTFDGQDLVLHYDADEYYGQVEETVIVSVRNLDMENGSVELDGVLYLFVPNRNQGIMEMESLCERLGIDHSVD